MDFQFISLHITYNSQHFEPNEYVNGLFWSLLIFQVNDPKVHIDLNDFPSFSELMIQKLQIQFSQLTTHLQWNENFDFTLMEILKNNYNPQLQYVVSLFNISCNTHITKKIKVIFNIY
jgi:hypothetical protein